MLKNTACTENPCRLLLLLNLFLFLCQACRFQVFLMLFVGFGIIIICVFVMAKIEIGNIGRIQRRIYRSEPRI